VQHAQKLRRAGCFFEQDAVQCRRVSMVIDSGTNEESQDVFEGVRQAGGEMSLGSGDAGLNVRIISSTRIASLFGKYW
jgi:hypothetical protein